MTPKDTAQDLLRAAARKIDANVEEFIPKLRDAKIYHDWQLKYIDSPQWKDLGVPIGLVAAIRCVLEEKKIVGRNASGKDSVNDISFIPSAPFQAQNLSPIPQSPVNRFVKASPRMMISLNGMESELKFQSPVSSKKRIGKDDSSSPSSRASASQLLPPSMPTRKTSHGIAPGSPMHNSDPESLSFADRVSSLRGVSPLTDAYLFDEQMNASAPILPVRIASLEDEGKWP